MANYEHARNRASVALLSLEEMQRNVEAVASVRLADGGQALPASRAVDRPPRATPPAGSPPADGQAALHELHVETRLMGPV